MDNFWLWYLVIGVIQHLIFYQPSPLQTWLQGVIPRALNILLWPLGLIGVVLIYRAKKVLKETKNVATDRDRTS